jgi:hypothetical protein
MLIRVTAPHFVAGAELHADGTIIRAAPIIRRFEGQTISQVVEYCSKWYRQWDVELYDT